MSDAERPGSPVPEAQQPREPQGPQLPYGPAGPYGAQQPGPYGQPQAGQQSGQQPPTSYNPVPGGPYGQQAGPNPYGPPGQPGQGPNPYGPPGQTGPYGAMPPGGSGKKSKLPLILIAAGVALLLLIGGVVALVRNSVDSADDPIGSGGSGTSTSTAPEASKPSDAVLGYLQALADQDPDKAIGYLEDEPADKTFLSREVLAVSAKRAAISAVDVPEVTDKYAYKVPATYQLGDRSVTEDYSVTEVGGAWKVSRAVTELDLSYQRDDTLPMKINGVEVKEDKVSLFPGYYAFTTDNAYVNFGSSNTLTLTGPSDYKSPRLTPTLTKDGKAAFVKATKAAFGKCLDQRKLRPSGCPNKLKEASGQKIKESSIRWSVSNDPFKNVRPTLDSTDPTSVSARFPTTYRIRATGTQNGRTVTFDGGLIGGSYSFRSTGDLGKKGIPVKLDTGF